MEGKTTVLAVVGPTASGKTALGVSLAQRFGGEIVSCDSMQIYQGLPIGTAQPTAKELSQVPHYLVAFLNPWESFSVSDYVNLAKEVITDISDRGKLPLLVGGTGLYARSLLRGFHFEEDCRDGQLRQELFLRAKMEGSDTLWKELNQLDPEAAQEIHPNNVKRVLRALEYCRLSGEPFSAQARRSREVEPPYRHLVLFLSFRDREALYRRIDLRVDKMLSSGLLKEAEGFYRQCQVRGMPPTAAQAIGYKEFFPYFAGECSLEQAAEDLKRESRRYAKRQLTWFAREPGAVRLFWEDYGGPQALFDGAAQLTEQFLKGESA